MVIEYREPGNGYREGFRKFLEPVFDPALGSASVPSALVLAAWVVKPVPQSRKVAAFE
jgi:hypothetical protein